MISPFRIFIVEDDTWYAELLQYHLGLNPDYEVHRFATGKEALANLYRKPQVLTLDYSLPDMNGEQVLKRMREQAPDTDVIMISGQEDVATAVNLLKLGAYDYILKDEETVNRLWKSVQNAREKQGLRCQVAKLLEEVGQKHSFSNLIKGQSAGIKRVFDLLDKAVRTNITVMVHGETGTGKELVAKAVHYNSERRSKPLVAVNMAAIPRDLLEAELFGYEKGAFTGAVARRVGKFEEAHKGTLFLDEIAELDLSLQAKILRVLQERELRRIGGSETVKLDFRLVVATHRNLATEVAEGRFRQDLYYRLQGIPIDLPPLRERGMDCLLLAKHFLDDFAKENKLKAKALSEAARQKVLAYAWPGNARELKAVMETALTLSDGPEIEEADLMLQPSARPGMAWLDQDVPLHRIEQEVITASVRRHGGNVIKAADALAISKSKIYQMIKSGEVLV
jgi:two-component system, NtrC family, response regulator AtoC